MFDSYAVRKIALKRKWHAKVFVCIGNQHISIYVAEN